MGRCKEIYEEGIATGNATFQNTAPDWEEWNNSHLKLCRLIAVENNEVIGWAALTPVSGRCVYAGVAEVSVYVAASARGKGAGKKLLNALIEESGGMYGALIVEEKTNISVDAERIFMIDDMKLNADNEFKRGNGFQRWFERHDGREGDTLLINGKENSVIEMHAEQAERWRLINASSAKYFYLSLSG